MYVIMVYDVSVERVVKVLKIGRRYLTWVQNSVLEGELTESKLARLIHEVKKAIDPSQDSVRFYIFRSEQEVQREIVGRSKNEPEWIV